MQIRIEISRSGYSVIFNLEWDDFSIPEMVIILSVYPAYSSRLTPKCQIHMHSILLILWAGIVCLDMRWCAFLFLSCLVCEDQIKLRGNSKTIIIHCTSGTDPGHTSQINTGFLFEEVPPQSWAHFTEGRSGGLTGRWPSLALNLHFLLFLSPLGDLFIHLLWRS